MRSPCHYCRRNRLSTLDTVVHIVDDEEAVRNSLAFLLTSAGFAVRVREPASHGTRHVVTEIMSNTALRYLIWPLRRPAAAVVPEAEDWVLQLAGAEPTPTGVEESTMVERQAA